MYIVREYKDEMAGKVIPDEMVVRAENGRWFTSEEVQDFKTKSTARCPTYGVCENCYGSGPVHMLCQKCKNKNEIYVIVKRHGKFLDAEWISRFFGTSHLEARGDRTQNWPRQFIWEMTTTQLHCYMSFRWPIGNMMRKVKPTYWNEYMTVLDEGIVSTTAGPWDGWDHPVEFLQWDDPNMYCGEDEK
jgi:hypothetical protein